MSYPHKEMIKSMRHRHTRIIRPEAAQGDAVQDTLGQKRLKDLSRAEVVRLYQKVRKECELKLRLEEWHAAGISALERFGIDYATMAKIELEIYRLRKDENRTRRAEAYQQAITMMGDEEEFKYLSRAENARRKTEKCKELTQGMAELLRLSLIHI